MLDLDLDLDLDLENVFGPAWKCFLERDLNVRTLRCQCWSDVLDHPSSNQHKQLAHNIIVNTLPSFFTPLLRK